ncbi:MAG: DsbC family protein [Gammaproteobacteria bacterium]|nr:DsbC family protein [Gammaproteobacteria bacterium]
MNLFQSHYPPTAQQPSLPNGYVMRFTPNAHCAGNKAPLGHYDNSSKPRSSPAKWPSRLSVFWVLLTSLWAAQAQEPRVAEPFSPEEMKLRLQNLYPSTHFSHIEQTPIPNVYQVDIGENIIYSDLSGRYFIFGHLMDMLEQQDLTQTKLAKKLKINFAQIPLDQAIKTVKGQGKQKIIIFSDPDCPFCQRLEDELQQMDDLTIYTLLYPIENLHPKAKAKAISIWCSDNPSLAWKKVMVDKLPIPTLHCAHPIDSIKVMAQQLGINGTPTLIAEDGRKWVGLTSHTELKQWLNTPSHSQ